MMNAAKTPPVPTAAIADMHTHILPRMDDGSDSAETSASMLRAEAEAGIRKIVLSPHFYPEREAPARFLSRRETALTELRVAYDPAAMPQLYLGAEVAYYNGIGNSSDVPQLCIVGTRFLLLEMPFCRWNVSVFDDIRRLKQNGISPIIAHIERYAAFQKHGIFRYLVENEIPLQSNAEYFLTPSTARVAVKQAKHGEIQLLGSDSHNLTDRKPNLGDAVSLIRQRVGEEFLDDVAACTDYVLRNATPVFVN